MALIVIYLDFGILDKIRISKNFDRNFFFFLAVLKSNYYKIFGDDVAILYSGRGLKFQNEMNGISKILTQTGWHLGVKQFK